ncbi:proline iminopeptidase [Cladochytrium replicatum]|nr:proline iminopeptidase [Cladochytrium replicatum]
MFLTRVLRRSKLLPRLPSPSLQPRSYRPFPKTPTLTHATSPMSHPLFAPIDPYDSGFLDVGDGHRIYYEQVGNPLGTPIVYLHGGPGGGIAPSDRQYFDPQKYRVVLFDQRGAGKSTPTAGLDNNTTWDLVKDIERIRVHVGGIDRWVVFGGSWGSTLSLTYAIKHPNRVRGLILRGIFTLRRSELLWYYQNGASHVFPDHFDDYLAPIPESERGDLISAYHTRLTHPDENVRLEAAKAWSRWECATSRMEVDPEMLAKVESDIWSLAFARIECHYFKNEGFFEKDGWILDNIDKIRHIPGVIVQGRYDVVCPATTAWDLHKQWPEADFHIVTAGHSAKEDEINSLLVQYAEKYSSLQ